MYRTYTIARSLVLKQIVMKLWNWADSVRLIVVLDVLYILEVNTAAIFQSDDRHYRK